MAKVTMDISELKSMEAQIETLGELKETLKKKNQEIDKVNKEKIKAFQDAENKVVYSRRITTYQNITHLVDREEIISDIIRQIYYAGRNKPGLRTSRDNDLIRLLRDFPYHEVVRNINFKNWFTTTENVLEGNPQEDIIIETKGLDKVKDDLRKEEISKLDKETKELFKMKDEFQDSEKKIRSLTKACNNYKESIDEITSSANETENELEALKIELSYYKAVYSDFMSTLKTIQKYCGNLFIRSSKIVIEMIQPSFKYKKETYDKYEREYRILKEVSGTDVKTIFDINEEFRVISGKRINSE